MTRFTWSLHAELLLRAFIKVRNFTCKFIVIESGAIVAGVRADGSKRLDKSRAYAAANMRQS